MNLKRIIGVALVVAPFMSGASVSANTISSSGLINRCSEGEFLDLSMNQCRSLDKNFGFSWKQFDQNKKSLAIDVNKCTEKSIRDAVTQVNSNGGGTINLPACTFKVSNVIWLGSNTVLQGEGAGKTILKDVSSGGVGLLKVETNNKARPSSENVIIRDITFIGIGAGKKSNILINDSANVLVERVEIEKPGRSGLLMVHSQKITMRYSGSHDSFSGGGIGNKDCFMKSSLDKNGDGVNKNECSGGKSRYWTENVAVYSNSFTGNGHNGINLHTSLLEVAGNIIKDNRYGAKFPEPANNLWVHDNYVSGNRERGFNPKTQSCGFIGKSMQVTNHVYYRNQIINNNLASDKPAFQVLLATNIMLFDNVFQNNGFSNQWRISDGCTASSTPTRLPMSTVSYCSGDEITSSKQVGGDTATKMTGSKCDLSKVANIFGLAGDLNGDKSLDLVDADLSLDYYGKKYAKIADLNFDGVVDGIDTDLIYQFIDAAGTSSTVAAVTPDDTTVGATGGATDGGTGVSADGGTGGSADGATGGSADGATDGSADGATGGSTGGATKLSLQELLQQIEGLQQEQARLLVKAQQAL